jgi:hypothetical protein
VIKGKGLALDRALCDVGTEAISLEAISSDAMSLLRTPQRRTQLKSQLEPVAHG